MENDSKPLCVIDPDTVPSSIQEELIDLASDSNARDDFETMSIQNFWVKCNKSYKAVSNVAFKVLLPFSTWPTTTYMCETDCPP